MKGFHGVKNTIFLLLRNDRMAEEFHGRQRDSIDNLLLYQNYPV